MKKMFMLMSLVLIMSISVPAYAQIVNTATGLAATIKDNNQNQNTNVNTDVNTNTNVNTFIPTNVNSNIQGQMQGQQQGQLQGQGQMQGQNNAQVISPSQEITFQAPDLSKQRVVVGAASPVAAPSEINFISPGQRDVTMIFPKFGCDVVKPLSKDDCIYDVLFVKEGIKIDSLYTEVLKALKDNKVLAVPASGKRYQIIECDSVKTWTTGGNINSSGVGTAGTGTVAGGGGIFPQIGRSKTSNLYTIYVVATQAFKATPKK